MAGSSRFNQLQSVATCQVARQHASSAPVEGERRIPELDTIIPYKKRAGKQRRTEKTPEWLKDVPPQYHSAIMSEVRRERGDCSTSVGAPSHVPSPSPSPMPARRPPIVYAIAPKTDAKDEKDEKDMKMEVKREKDETTGTSAEATPDAEPEPATVAVHVNAAGVMVSGKALGPKATVQPPAAAADGDGTPDVLEMEELLRVAHAKHGAAQKAAAALKRPAAATVAARVVPMRLHTPRRCRGKAAAPLGIHGLKQSQIENKASVSKTLNAFQSWAYDTMRARLRRAGYADDFAKNQARMWHKVVKPVWVRVRG